MTCLQTLLGLWWHGSVPETCYCSALLVVLLLQLALLCSAWAPAAAAGCDVHTPAAYYQCAVFLTASKISKCRG